MPLTVASWNINSVRPRLACVGRFLEERRPDVLCLQEIKVESARFPGDEFRRLGYGHQAVHGQKGYHGVAILSRRPFADAASRDWCGSPEARHVYVTLEGGLEIHDFYVPSGGDVADRKANPKFDFKLKFLAAMARWFKARRKPGNRFVLVGDLNVAPLESDVWSHSQLLGVVSHTPVEVVHLSRLQRAHDWVDAVRYFVPPDRKLYSWWSYRARDWAVSDRGRRLDHVWVTPALAPALVSAEILRAARGWPQASDHVPVLATLEA